jgi:hypothetical protein
VYNRYTQKRRPLWACRERGLTFDDMVTLIRNVCADYTVDLGVVEQNGFQRWLHQHLAKYAETNTRIFGHTTGVEKQSLEEGIPGMKLALQSHLWEVPSGKDVGGRVVDQRAAEWAAIWQSELNAFGYVDGHLQGAGASWTSGPPSGPPSGSPN